MSDIIIHKKNEVYIKLECEPHILYELAPYFSFSLESAKFMPQYRKGRGWDGEIRLLSTATGEIYAGLLDRVIAKIKNHGYSYEFRENKYYGLPFEVNEEITEEGVKGYMNYICKFTPYDYQVNTVYECLRYNRKTVVSATSSGKSYMIYSLVRYYVNKKMKCLVVFPTTSLIHQMFKDWCDYGWNAENHCHMIYSGQEKSSDMPVTLSTWQSIHKLDKSFFEDYDCVIVDECFSENMRVLTPYGYKKIVELVEGDFIINFDENEKIFKQDTVVKIHKNLNKSQGEKMYRLDFDNGVSIEVTGNHKFLTNKGWVRADELTELHDIINIS